MKKALIILLLIGGGILYSSYKLKMHASRDILAVLGIPNEDFVLNGILCANNPNCFIGGPPPMSNLSTLRALSTGDKIKVASEFFEYTKAYYNSQEFKDRYEQKRMEMKPRVSEITPEQREAALAQVAEMEEMWSPEVLEMLPPESRAGALKSLEDMKAQANGGMSESQKKRWEELIPENPNIAIKLALQDFLDKTVDVDFNATTKLNPQNKHQVFTNPLYEKKDGQWKTCYRAGKELTSTARTFVKEWLNELN